MRYLAITRFRLLTICRTGTPIFVIAVLPPLVAAIALSQSEPDFRDGAEFLLGVNAFGAVVAAVLHALILSGACEMSGKIKTPHDFIQTDRTPDLMDTAPISDRARFWGETLGALGATIIIHLCCLPLLAAAAALSPLPTFMFLWIEAGTLASFFVASAGAAWQRRAPQTKYSASRGPRSTALLFILLSIVIVATTRPRAFRDALLEFMTQQTSVRAWARVVQAVESPFLLIMLLSLLYAGTIAYYYRSATRRPTWEN